MATIYPGAGADLGPSLGLETKPHKLALHVRGRIIIGGNMLLWSAIVAAIRYCL